MTPVEILTALVMVLLGINLLLTAFGDHSRKTQGASSEVQFIDSCLYIAFFALVYLIARACF